MKKLLVTSLTCLMMISCNQKENPLLSEFSTPFGVPPFEQIKPEHYMPAFEEGIRQHDAEIAAIIANPETPTFKNTIEPLEFSGMLLTQVNRQRDFAQTDRALRQHLAQRRTLCPN